MSFFAKKSEPVAHKAPSAHSQNKRTEDKINYQKPDITTEKKPDVYRTPLDAEQVKTKAENYKDKYYSQKAYKQFGLKDLTASMSQHINFKTFLIGMISLVTAATVFALSNSVLPNLFDTSQIYNAYVQSFVTILPVLFGISVYIAGASVISKIVIQSEEKEPNSNLNNIGLFFKTLLISVFTGAPALFFINVLLVFFSADSFSWNPDLFPSLFFLSTRPAC
jgi:hypothetical protein